MIKLYGFSFLKDGVRYDYPFQEAFSSMSPIVDKIYIALGQNDDGTKELLETMPKVQLIHTVWNMELLGQGGVIFSEQTNIALSELRKNHAHEEKAWGIYLQSDELLHEDSLPQLLKDIEKAEEQGCDAIRFRYFHFWKSHYQIATNKRWYPSEIRAIKLDSKVINHGDAQGFSHFTKVYESDVYIHHYGHVRDEEKRQEKQKFLIKSIRSADKFQKYFKREQKAFSETKTLPLLLNHPKIMKERIEKMGESFSRAETKEVFILGNKEDYSTDLVSKINAKKVHWVHKIQQIPREKRNKAIILEPSFWQKIFYPSRVGRSMESSLAREWDRDTLLILKLSEKGVSIR